MAAEKETPTNTSGGSAGEPAVLRAQLRSKQIIKRLLEEEEASAATLKAEATKAAEKEAAHALIGLASAATPKPAEVSYGMVEVTPDEMKELRKQYKEDLRLAQEIKDRSERIARIGRVCKAWQILERYNPSESDKAYAAAYKELKEIVKAKAAATRKPDAQPDAKEKPELYEEAFGPYTTAQEAMKKREELMTQKGFPMVSQSRISQQKSGFILAVTFRSRFPASPPAAAVKEELFDSVPGYADPDAASDRKD